LPPRFGTEREAMPYCTSIYYLVEAPDFSAFHRIKADELWYFHAGTGIAIHCLDRDGGCRRIDLGPCGEYFGAVAAGTWFAAEPCIIGPAGAEPSGAPAGRAWALVSCAVSPGFDYRDFELADRAALCREYPDRRSHIERLTRP
jgi:predicted cupin superfamily sugar epimerase